MNLERVPPERIKKFSAAELQNFLLARLPLEDYRDFIATLRENDVGGEALVNMDNDDYDALGISQEQRERVYLLLYPVDHPKTQAKQPNPQQPSFSRPHAIPPSKLPAIPPSSYSPPQRPFPPPSPRSSFPDSQMNDQAKPHPPSKPLPRPVQSPPQHQPQKPETQKALTIRAKPQLQGRGPKHRKINDGPEVIVIDGCGGGEVPRGVGVKDNAKDNAKDNTADSPTDNGVKDNAKANGAQANGAQANGAQANGDEGKKVGRSKPRQEKDDVVTPFDPDGDLLRPQIAPPSLQNCLNCDARFKGSELGGFPSLCRRCEKGLLEDLSRWQKEDDDCGDSGPWFKDCQSNLVGSLMPDAKKLGCRQCSPHRGRSQPLCLKNVWDFCLTCNRCICADCYIDLHGDHETVPIIGSEFKSVYDASINIIRGLEASEPDRDEKKQIRLFSCWFMCQEEPEIQKSDGKAAQYLMSVKYKANTRRSYVSPYSIARSEGWVAYADLQSLSVKRRKVFFDEETNATHEVRQDDIHKPKPPVALEVRPLGEKACVPTCVFLDGDLLFVLYGQEGKVSVFSPDGECNKDLGLGVLSGDCLSIVLFEGMILVADRGNQCVHVLYRNGRAPKRLGTSSFHPLFSPVALAVDKWRHELYLLDSSRNEIRILNFELVLYPKEIKLSVNHVKSFVVTEDDVILASIASFQLLFIKKNEKNSLPEARGPKFEALTGVALCGDSLLVCSVEGRITNFSLAELKARKWPVYHKDLTQT